MKNDFEIRGDVTAIFLHRRGETALECLIDTADLPMVKGFKWVSKRAPHHKTFYVAGYQKGSKLIFLHRLLLNAPKNSLVDHKDGNGLNNTRSNLRLADKSLNAQNHTSLVSTNKSGVHGVSWHKPSQKWYTKLTVNGKQIYLGTYSDLGKAAQVVAEARARLMPYSQEALHYGQG